MKINEMTYGKNSGLKLYDVKVLFKSKYKGIQYVIVNYGGSHPCAYVEVTGTKIDECKEFNKLKEKARSKYWFKRNRKKLNEADRSIYCHGGITYSSWRCPFVHEPKMMDTQTRWYIGWDYAHYDDFVAGLAPHKGKKWTTEEIIEECKNVIENVLSLK